MMLKTTLAKAEHTEEKENRMKKKQNEREKNPEMRNNKRKKQKKKIINGENRERFGWTSLARA